MYNTLPFVVVVTLTSISSLSVTILKYLPFTNYIILNKFEKLSWLNITKFKVYFIEY